MFGIDILFKVSQCKFTWTVAFVAKNDNYGIIIHFEMYCNSAKVEKSPKSDTLFNFK